MEKKIGHIVGGGYGAIGAALALGAAVASAAGIPDRPRVNTKTIDRDMERAAAAEEKRQRKAAKLRSRGL